MDAGRLYDFAKKLDEFEENLDEFAKNICTKLVFKCETKGFLIIFS